jgi:hypothetical protein
VRGLGGGGNPQLKKRCAVGYNNFNNLVEKVLKKRTKTKLLAKRDGNKHFFHFYTIQNRNAVSSQVGTVPTRYRYPLYIYLPNVTNAVSSQVGTVPTPYRYLLYIYLPNVTNAVSSQVGTVPTRYRTEYGSIFICICIFETFMMGSDPRFRTRFCVSFVF